MTRHELEEAIVARVLSDNSEYAKIEDLLLPSAFEDETLAWVYEWLGWEIASGGKASLVTLKRAQRSSPSLGDAAVLAGLAASLVRVGDVEDWVREMRLGASA